MKAVIITNIKTQTIKMKLISKVEICVRMKVHIQRRIVKRDRKFSNMKSK